jgi:hypothetical protein
MMTYSEWQREAPQDAEPMTDEEWAAYHLELDRENQAGEQDG